MSDRAARLRDEIVLLEASIADARAEHQTGDLDDAALVALVERDEARLVDARQRLARLSDMPSPPSRAPTGQPSIRARRRGRLLVLAASCLVLAAVAAVLAATDPFAATTRLPRATTAFRAKVLLVAAELDVARDLPLRAMSAYDAVLRLEPHDGEALIESGWLRYEEGLALRRTSWVRDGAAMLGHAVVAAPNDAASHLYDGIVLYQYDKDRTAALGQLRRAGELPESQNEQEVTATFLALLDPSH